MSDFDLDLRHAEEQIEMAEYEGRLVLGVLDGSTDPGEWVAEIEQGNVLILAVEGDLSELASEFAREIKDLNGELMHFRRFLLVAPPGVDIDTDRL